MTRAAAGPAPCPTSGPAPDDIAAKHDREAFDGPQPEQEPAPSQGDQDTICVRPPGQAPPFRADTGAARAHEAMSSPGQAARGDLSSADVVWSGVGLELTVTAHGSLADTFTFVVPAVE